MKGGGVLEVSEVLLLHSPKTQARRRRRHARHKSVPTIAISSRSATVALVQAEQLLASMSTAKPVVASAAVAAVLSIS